MPHLSIPKKGRKPTSRQSFRRLEQRVAAIEALGAQPINRLQAVEDWIEFTFERALWELPALSALSSQYDQAARREQLGYLHAAVIVNEKLGRTTPDHISRMVLALAGDKVFEPSAATEPTVVRIPALSDQLKLNKGGVP